MDGRGLLLASDVATLSVGSLALPGQESLAFWGLQCGFDGLPVAVREGQDRGCGADERRKRREIGQQASVGAMGRKGWVARVALEREDQGTESEVENHLQHGPGKTGHKGTSG